MLSLTDRASVSRALSDTTLAPDLRALIGLRAWQLHVEQGRPLGSRFKLIIVQGGDTPHMINAALGLVITGDSAEDHPVDWIKDHEGQWFEISLPQIDGVPTRVFVENGPGTELGIHYLCLSHFCPDSEGTEA